LERVLYAFVCAATLFATGCRKQNQSAESPSAVPAPPSQTDASQATATTPAPAVNPTTPPAATATNALPDLRPLNQALMGWIVRNQRHPANFEDFAATAGIQIPPPPPGKKYIINGRGLISLVNQ
jgi:hypothetical protein